MVLRTIGRKYPIQYIWYTHTWWYMVHGTHTYIHTPIHIYIYIINIHVHTHIYTMHTTHTCQCTKVLYTTNSDIKKYDNLKYTVHLLYIIIHYYTCTIFILYIRKRKETHFVIHVFLITIIIMIISISTCKHTVVLCIQSTCSATV